LTTYDTIDGGAGTADTLSLVDTVDITSLVATIKNVEVATIKTTGAIGSKAAASPTVAQQVVDYTSPTASSTVTLTVGTLDAVISTGANLSETTTNTATGIKAALEAQGYTVATAATGTAAAAADTTSIKVVYDTTDGKVFVTGLSTGTAVPAITVKAAGSANSFPAVTTTAGVAASSSGSALSLSGAKELLTATVTSSKDANVSALKTTDVTLTATTVARVGGGDDVVITGTGGATSEYATGSVTITEKKAGAVKVWGGTTVSITKGGTALDTTTGEATGSAYAGNITVGTAPNIVSNPETTTGYPQVDENVDDQPTGNVTIKNYTNWTSLTGQASRTYGSGTANVQTNGATEVSVATAGAVTINDAQTALKQASSSPPAVAGTSTLTKATFDGIAAASTVTSGALNAVKAINTSGSAAVTVTNATLGGHALALTLGNNSALTVTDATATSVSVSTETSTLSTVANASQVAFNLVADKATSVSFANAQAVTLGGSSSLKLATSVTATGSGTLDLGTVGSTTSGASTVKITSVDGSAATGAITASIATTITTTAGGSTNHSLNFKGGAGNDVITLTGDMRSGTNAAGAVVQNTIDLGAGNDRLVKSGGSIAAGSTVSGGEGTDTIASSLLTAGNAAQITGFEVLGLDQTGTYDTDLLAGATGLGMLALGGTWTNVEKAQGLSIVNGASSASSTATTLTFTAAEVSGTADAYTVSFAQSAPTSTATSRTTSDAGVVVVAGIENITVESGGTGFLSNAITLTGANARNVTLTGAQNLSIDFSANFGGTTAATSSNGLGIATIDGSAMTGKLTVDTAGALVAFTATTVKGGSAADTITLSDLTNKGVVDAGAGNDKIITAADSVKVTGGAGNDTFDVTLSVAYASSAATDDVTTIEDFAAGDVIDFIGGTNGTHTATTDSFAKLTLTTQNSVSECILSALNLSPKATSGAKEVTWFVYGSNTYVVFDASDDTSTDAGLAANDVVVKLTGVIDLSTATFDATNGSVTIPV
jgi:S-layer protein